MPAPIKLTPEDRKKFQEGCKSMNPAEILALSDFIERSRRFTEKDLRFMWSCIGKRCEKMLRNAVQRFSFDDEGRGQA